ncbi:UDP-N-acetylmuramoyl-tripeptide--D-alanyl-D-alanine ligase [Ulvibacter litoralis]|uniref:UDP-N-acetylmuramoyl-tripeptide--D-alanyl-D-alanine ligase n=1 Tax=Ulvibacter litoralis TaxID=227084 RepID=A0A1G7C1Z5_9FLAO|nr:UDP-N-acetylmuramoyl-tripeptide--D-alanyl-D-alanine ligase [Ulvibacter litoralis]GHC48951.1 UDP-N-acetylmuramoyl-tripeptide--D-alanyl-D-alanine ligase [Ulvibacter litoralis]SDE33341.1 UDP-N-acetylmuramoyl-tripeptide--D-alanyl-D-alanine ligase [Ulvibacter litoralis]
MKIETVYQHFIASTGICTDTRKIKKGCLFFALKGDNFNGNKFTEEALTKGALKVIIDEEEYHKPTGETIRCPNSLELLQELATYHRKQLNIPIIALTGSNGKTTTKELINAVLKQKYNTTATVGNLNNHIGVPLTLLSMTKDTEIGIIEMGANHPKEIALLCEIAQPDYGYITNFGKAHLEGFGSIEGVIKAKTELYEYLRKHQKTVFINANDPIQKSLSEGIQRNTFGTEGQDIGVTLLNSKKELVVSFKNLDIKSNLIGIYNFNNIAAAIAIGDYFKVSSEKIKTAIEAYTPTNNRSQRIEKDTNQIILDAYNANPTSMLAALENFKQAEGDNKVLFLGDMFELGAEAASEHQKITDYLTENNLGTTYLLGSNFFKTKSNASNILQFETFEDFKAQFSEKSIQKSFILIKGSRGMALERITELL